MVKFHWPRQRGAMHIIEQLFAYDIDVDAH